MHGCHEVLQPHPVREPLLVAHLADRFGAADLDAVHRGGNDDLLLHHLLADLVVPDLHLDATVLRPPLFGQVGGDRAGVAEPLVGDRLGGEPQGALAVLGSGPGALAGEPGVVGEFSLEGGAQPLAVRVPNEVEPDVLAPAHLLQHAAQKVEVFPGDLGVAGAEVDRRDEVRHLDRLHVLLGDLALLGAVPLVLAEDGGVEEPRRVAHVLRKVPLGRLAGAGRLANAGSGTRRGGGGRNRRLDRGGRTGLLRGGGACRANQEQACKGDTLLHHFSHPSGQRGRVALFFSIPVGRHHGGAPRRQKTSVSTVRG